MALIVFEKGRLRGKRLSLPQEGVIRIGRESACTVRLADPMVSRLHCVLVGTKGVWRVEDKSSSNGTFVNGQRTPGCTLASGDLVQVGSTVFSYLQTLRDPLVGKVVAGYRIEERVGRGGMGTVYRALQCSLDRLVALKILAARYSENKTFVARFTQEAKAAAKLNHPNVVQIFDAGSASLPGEGSSETLHYIAMEFLAGGTLEDVVAADGPLAPFDAVRVGCQALAALSFAEEHGIVHRDIKPANLMFTSEGVVKVCDLGIAVDLADPKALWAGTAAGSPAYMAPEQARGGAVDHRVDIYAVGATLYHALSGAPPFEGPTARDVLKKKLTSDPVPLRQKAPGVPLRLARVVETMMARDPAQRYPSAEQAAAHLSAAAKAASAPRQRRRKAAKRRPSRRSSVSAAVPVIAVLGGLLVVAAVLGLFRGSPRRRQEASRHRGSEPAAVSAPEKESQSEERLAPSPEPRRPASPRGGAEAVSGPEAPSRGEDLLLASTLSRAELLISSGKLREAEGLLAQLPDSGPFKEKRAELTARLKHQAAEALAAAKKHLQSYCLQAAFEKAESELASLTGSLPSYLTAQIEELRSLVEKARSAYRKERTALTAALEQVWPQLARLKATEAEKLLLGCNVTFQVLQKEKQSALRGAQGASRALALLQELFSNFAKLRRTLGARFPPNPIIGKTQPEKQWKVLRFQEGHLLTLGETSGGKEVILQSIFQLDPFFLAALLAEENDPSLPEGTREEAVGLLYLLRSGPERARPLLTNEKLPEAVRVANEKLCSDLGKVYLTVGMEELQARFDRYRGQKAPPGGFAYTAREAARLARAWKASGEIPQSLKTIFTVSYTESLLSGSKADFFSATSFRQLRGNVVHLTYEFTRAEEARDFDLLGGELKIIPEEKVLHLRGEARLLHGFPFEKYLAVQGKVVECDPESPNVNFAFWTEVGEKVGIDLKKLNVGAWIRRLNLQIRPEYVLCGIGYRVVFNIDRFLGPFGRPRGGGGGRGRVEAAGAPRGGGQRGTPWGPIVTGPVYLREPALVIMAGEHGRDLGWAPGQLLWSAGARGQVSAPFVFAIELKLGVLRWSLNGKAVPFKRTGPIARFPVTLSREGSLNIVTNGSVVRFGRLEIRGKLREDWITKEAVRVAESAWKSIAGEGEKKLQGEGSSPTSRAPQ